LAAGPIFRIRTVKDVPGQFVNHVVRLDTKPALSGPPVGLREVIAITPE
jgi:hypothetical protein